MGEVFLVGCLEVLVLICGAPLIISVRWIFLLWGVDSVGVSSLLVYFEILCIYIRLPV